MIQSNIITFSHQNIHELKRQGEIESVMHNPV